MRLKNLALMSALAMAASSTPPTEYKVQPRHHVVPQRAQDEKLAKAKAKREMRAAKRARHPKASV